MNKKVLATLLTGSLLVSATACSASSPSPASTTVGNHNSYAGMAAEETTAYYGDAVEGEAWEEDFNTEEYNTIKENGFMYVTQNPLSTFAADVDTGSYCNLRRMVRGGWGLDNVVSSIRTEEMINYFDYTVDSEEDVFSVQYSVGDCPWNKDNKLLVMTMQANSEINVPNEGNNFVFLIDSSGSMSSSDKLDLARESFKLLAGTLGPNDRVSIVTYSGSYETLLEGSNDYKKICKVLDSITAHGGTNGSGGITAAYECATKNFIKNGNNRVIIASDGDMNLGITSQSGLVDLITQEKESGVFLTVLGFGSGNYSDANMESIADAGNGNYFYIDSIEEAERVLCEKMKQTTVTVAKDVKFQVEFNPAVVNAYRLIGYENRVMDAVDFNNDKKDGGEVGSGHTVVALYEIIPVGAQSAIDLKYQQVESSAVDTGSDDFATIKIRYKEPDEDKSQLLTFVADKEKFTEKPSDNLAFAGLVSEFAMLLSESDYSGTIEFADIMKAYKELDYTDDYREEFYDLVRMMAKRS